MRVLLWAALIFVCALGNGCAYQIVQSGKISDEKLSALQERTATARGLPFLHALRFELVDQRQTRVILAALALRDMPKEKWDAWESVFRCLDAIPADYRLYDQILNLMVDQAAGFYDPAAKKMYISTKPLPVGPLIPLLEMLMQRDLTREFILSHELVHALQDQHFDLNKSLMSKAREFDESLAVHAVVEGDALIGGMIAMTGNAALIFQKKDLGRQMQAQASGAASLAAVPPVIREYLVFPYAAGLEFVQAYVAKNTWRNVDGVYKNLPVSSEQVLHPEKYFAGEKPVAVSLDEAKRRLGGDWKILEENTLGEAFIGVIFGKEAAAGWGGDRFLLARLESKETFIWETRWDSQKDAEEFYKAVAARKGAWETVQMNESTVALTRVQ